MDYTKKYENRSPEESANILNKLFFCWVLPFFKVGYENDLHVEDIYNTTKQDLSQDLGDKLEREWNREVLNSEKNKSPPSLKRAIWRIIRRPYMIQGIFLFSIVITRLGLPIVLGYYVQYFEKNSLKIPGRGWMLGAGIVLISFFNLAVHHYASINCARIGMQVRIACSALIYRKLLKLNHTSLGKTTAGELVNLLSNDVVRFDFAMPFLHFIWIMPFLGLGGLIVMYAYIGLAALPTMAVMTLQAIFGQGYLSKLQGKYRGKIARLSDQRVKLMGEITSGIQVIKMYAWEKPFEKIVETARRKEVNMIARTSYIKGFSSALNIFVERATLYIAIVSFVLLGNFITGEVVFSMAQLLNTIQLYMSIMFPIAYSSYEEAKVSVRRIEEFLKREEKSNAIYSNNAPTASGGIKLVKARASWRPNPIVHTLVDLNLDVKSGTLCCVVGSVGSGKSSLLQVILRELPLNKGTMDISGNISYAAQEPWLFSSNVRQNVLFGMPYEKERYKEVVKVCALQRDFEELPFGDKTPVGEKGSALSGGQRARVALARAVYRNADIYLMDDPLSAVDAHVAKHLFEKCIQQYLKDKTRILVTHQVQFLKGADLVVIMNNGTIDKVGTFDDLKQDIFSLSEEVDRREASLENQPIQKELNTNLNRKLSGTNVPKRERLKSISSIISMVGTEPDETDELIEKGSIPASTYVTYFKAGNSIIILGILLVVIVVSQVLCNASDMWITHWTNKEELRHLERQKELDQSVKSFVQDNITDAFTIGITTALPILDNFTSFQFNASEFILDNKDNSEMSPIIYMLIYTILITLAVILTSLRSTMFYKICMNASKTLHNRMFANVLKAPMSFFDSNPSGRILNRFSKDVGAVDEVLPKCALDTLQIFLVMAGILGMVFIVSPLMIIPAIILGYLFVFARNVYLASAQDIKRLEGTTKAPVFSHVSASLFGISSIRAFKAQDMISREFDTLQDQHTGTWCLLLYTSEALGFYLDVISTVFLALVTFQFLIFESENTVSGNVGLVIAQSLILTGMLQFGVRQSAEVSSNMTSVERVLQYTRLEEEGPWEPLPAHRPASDWPNLGHVDMKHAYLRYTPDGQPAIKDLNVEFKPGEKVGVVGRTGAGKSSLVATLFRLAPVEGHVIIDGLDTADVGLKPLRSSISIIPQVPTLFSGTLRYNLDPFEKCSDDQLWQAIERVELKQTGATLDTSVSEGGANFSAGQRQLICLARAIVRNHKLLVMDEATANVDQQTDSLIQSTIRQVFRDCTVITIAHRINTIIDCDQVLVMDHGEAVEFGPPHELLQKKDGYFSKMVAQTGERMENMLRKTAEETYHRKKAISNDQVADSDQKKVSGD